MSTWPSAESKQKSLCGRSLRVQPRAATPGLGSLVQGGRIGDAGNNIGRVGPRRVARCRWGRARADDMTLTGTVGDAACGVTHMPDGCLRSAVRTRCRTDAAKCTLACVSHVGIASDFALIVGDTAYTLETSSDALREELEKLAGMMATITGDVTGETIAVASVTMAH